MKKYTLFITFIVLVNVTLRAQVNLNNGLTACYPLDGTGVEAINNLTGTLYGVSPGLDRFGVVGSALDFYGSTGSYIELPESLLIKPNESLSFSCWIKTTSTVDQYILFTKNSLSSYFEAYVLCIDPSYHFMTRKSGSSGMDMVVSTTPASLNTWYHLVTTIDDSQVKLYVNGILEASTPSTFNGFDYMSGKKVIIGGSNEPSYNAPFAGTIDNIRFYNRIISSSEVTALYSQDVACKDVVTTSLPSIKTLSGIKFFPNPVSEKLKVQSDIDSEIEFYLTNILGDMVNQGTLNSQSDFEIDMSSLPAGIYTLNTKMNNKTFVDKIVKQ